jgi:hypothetical protein
MKEPLAQILITVTEAGISGLAIEANDELQTKAAYKILLYIADDLRFLDESIASKGLGRRLREMREFMTEERLGEAEEKLLRFLSPAEVADA